MTSRHLSRLLLHLPVGITLVPWKSIPAVDQRWLWSRFHSAPPAAGIGNKPEDPELVVLLRGRVRPNDKLRTAHRELRESHCGASGPSPACTPDERGRARAIEPVSVTCAVGGQREAPGCETMCQPLIGGTRYSGVHGCVFLRLRRPTAFLKNGRCAPQKAACDGASVARDCGTGAIDAAALQEVQLEVEVLPRRPLPTMPAGRDLTAIALIPSWILRDRPSLSLAQKIEETLTTSIVICRKGFINRERARQMPSQPCREKMVDSRLNGSRTAQAVLITEFHSTTPSDLLLAAEHAAKRGYTFLVLHRGDGQGLAQACGLQLHSPSAQLPALFSSLEMELEVVRRDEEAALQFAARQVAQAALLELGRLSSSDIGCLSFRDAEVPDASRSRAADDPLGMDDEERQAQCGERVAASMDCTGRRNADFVQEIQCQLQALDEEIYEKNRQKSLAEVLSAAASEAASPGAAEALLAAWGWSASLFEPEALGPSKSEIGGGSRCDNLPQSSAAAGDRTPVHCGVPQATRWAKTTVLLPVVRSGVCAFGTCVSISQRALLQCPHVYRTACALYGVGAVSADVAAWTTDGADDPLRAPVTFRSLEGGSMVEARDRVARRVLLPHLVAGQSPLLPLLCAGKNRHRRLHPGLVRLSSRWALAGDDYGGGVAGRVVRLPADTVALGREVRWEWFEGKWGPFSHLLECIEDDVMALGNSTYVLPVSEAFVRYTLLPLMASFASLAPTGAAPTAGRAAGPQDRAAPSAAASALPAKQRRRRRRRSFQRMSVCILSFFNAVHRGVTVSPPMTGARSRPCRRGRRPPRGRSEIVVQLRWRDGPPGDAGVDDARFTVVHLPAILRYLAQYPRLFVVSCDGSRVSFRPGVRCSPRRGETTIAIPLAR